MFLHKIILNPLCKEARRDLVNPYEMHSSLCRVFSPPETKCPPGAFLWRLEIPKDKQSSPQILVQSALFPDWSRIGVSDWFDSPPSIPIDLESRLALKNLQIGQNFRFRLRANPSVCRGGKRLGLFQNQDQINWLVNKGLSNGFKLLQTSSLLMEDANSVNLINVSEKKMLIGKQRSGHQISVYSVCYDGILMLTEVEKFMTALKTGIGHGKTMGLGLLSVAPII